MIPHIQRNQEGSVAILSGLVLLALLGFATLGIDIANLLVARNELQNAADAGALAGAQVLYNDAGTEVNINANQTAYDTATSNKSQGSTIEINAGDIERGHWRFATETFTHNDATSPVDLWNVSEAVLDANLNFINAVKVTARRNATPVASFFAGIFGYEDFQLEAEGVAYIGFAGTLLPEDVDEPIAICAGAITGWGNDEYTCLYGRMINSGQDDVTGETGGWTSFEQDNACTGGTNAAEVSALICGNGNPEAIDLSFPIATNGGNIQSAFNDFFNCWTSNSNQTTLWELTLPVVYCPGNNVGTCEELSGAVTINIVWITGAGEDPQFNDIPVSMEGWSQGACSNLGEVAGRESCWNSFVTHFNLQTFAGAPAPYMKKCIYFLPDCTPHAPAGVTGGKNYGVLAKIPVLVN